MTKLANRHVVIIGGSGSGKTTHEVAELIEEAEAGETAIVVLDPHTDSLASSFYAHLCARQLQHRVIYDQLTAFDRVPRWDFLTASTAKDPREREGENHTRCEQFTEILLRRRGKASAADTPLLEEWMLAALNLFIFQPRRRPLSDIRYAFRFEHPVFTSMLEECRHSDTVEKFHETISRKQTPFMSADRLIQGIFRSASFRVRTDHGGGFNLGRHLDNKGIVIVEGGEGGALSHDAMTVMMGAIVQKTLCFIRERKREHPQITVVMDEANNAQLVGEAGHETRALSELRKYGLGMHILVQMLDFPNSKIEKNVLTNCATRKYFNCSEVSTAARLGADLGGAYETDEIQHRHYKDGSSWDAPVTVQNPYAEDLRNFGVGQYYERKQNVNVQKQSTLMPQPFGLSDRALVAVIDGFLNETKKRPEYYEPDKAPATPVRTQTKDVAPLHPDYGKRTKANRAKTGRDRAQQSTTEGSPEPVLTPSQLPPGTTFVPGVFAFSGVASEDDADIVDANGFTQTGKHPDAAKLLGNESHPSNESHPPDESQLAIEAVPTDDEPETSVDDDDPFGIL